MLSEAAVNITDVQTRDDLKLLLKAHDRMQAEFGLRLRKRLEASRGERLKQRQNKIMNENLSKRWEQSLQPRQANVRIGKNEESTFGWKHIENHGEDDRRLRMYKKANLCKVISVKEWIHGEQRPTVTERLTQSKTVDLPPLNSARRKEANVRDKSSPSTNSGSLTKKHSSRKLRKQSEFGETTIATEREILQDESDFCTLSYGESHVMFQTLKMYGSDYASSFGGRRVMFAEFIDYLQDNDLDALPFAAFVSVVHPMWTREDVVVGVRKFAKRVNWALGLSLETATFVHRLWCMAEKEEDDGDEVISYDGFCRLVDIDSFAMDERDVRQMYYAIDEDGSGFLGKDEFAKFLAGNVNVADVDMPTPVRREDSPLGPNPNSSSGGHSGLPSAQSARARIQ